MSLVCIEPLESRIAPAVIYVTTLGDHEKTGYTTLQDALNQANSAVTPATIEFGSATHVLKGAITLASPLPSITAAVSIVAPGITINGAGRFQGVSITGGDTVSISGLGIIHCKAIVGAGLYVSDPGANITISNAVFEGNHAFGQKGQGSTGKGGGLYINDLGGTVIISNSVIEGNQAAGEARDGAHGHGGGIYNEAGALTLQHTTVADNSAIGTNGNSTHSTGGLATGGGIYSNDVLIVNNCSITGNSAIAGNGAAGGNAGGEASGGGIHCGRSVIMTNSQVTGNTVRAGNGGAGTNYGGKNSGSGGGAGGGAYGGGVDGAATITIRSSLISGNAVTGGTGSPAGRTYNLDVTNGFTSAGNGYAGGAGGRGSGGGVHASGNLNIIDATISGNTVKSGTGGTGGDGGNAGKGLIGGSGGIGGDGGLAHAGGVMASGDTVTIRSSTISGNSVHAGKAGAGGAAGVAANPGVPGTYDDSYGGAFDCYGATVTLSEITVTGNLARAGAGIHIGATSTATIQNSTIVLNKSTLHGGGLDVDLTDGGSASVVSTIIALNTAKTNADISGFTDDPAYHNLIGINPLLGALGYHDGGSTETMLPAADSPAVVGGPGSNPTGLTADQNGQAFGSSILIGAVQTTA